MLLNLQKKTDKLVFQPLLTKKTVTLQFPIMALEWMNNN